MYGLITDQPVSILDIGAGAGFPSLPMKIIFPELEVTIIDSLNKRINFLSLLTEELGLENVTLLHGRAEDFGQDSNYRATFDFVTARAVARLSVLSEFTIPFLKKNGNLLSLKAAQFEEELTDAKKPLQFWAENLSRKSLMNCLMAMNATLPSLKRKKKHQRNTHVKQALLLKVQ